VAIGRVFHLLNALDPGKKNEKGKQWVKSVDSVAANLSEGYGRYHIRDAKNFNYFSRRSLSETKTWLVKAHNQKLITDIRFDRLLTNT